MKKYSYFKELQPISKPKICTKVLKSFLTIQNVTVIEYTPRPFLERTGWLSVVRDKRAGLPAVRQVMKNLG